MLIRLLVTNSHCIGCIDYFALQFKLNSVICLFTRNSKLCLHLRCLLLRWKLSWNVKIFHFSRSRVSAGLILIAMTRQGAAASQESVRNKWKGGGEVVAAPGLP